MLDLLNTKKISLIMKTAIQKIRWIFSPKRELYICLRFVFGSWIKNKKVSSSKPANEWAGKGPSPNSKRVGNFPPID